MSNKLIVIVVNDRVHRKHIENDELTIVFIQNNESFRGFNADRVYITCDIDDEFRFNVLNPLVRRKKGLIEDLYLGD